MSDWASADLDERLMAAGRVCPCDTCAADFWKRRAGALEIENREWSEKYVALLLEAEKEPKSVDEWRAIAKHEVALSFLSEMHALEHEVEEKVKAADRAREYWQEGVGARVLTVLRSIEWSGPVMDWGERSCPVCKGLEFARHADQGDGGTCPLGELILDLEIVL